SDTAAGPIGRDGVRPADIIAPDSGLRNAAAVSWDSMGAGARTPLWPYVRGIGHYDIAGMPPGVHVGMPSPAVTMVLPLGAPLDLAMPAIGRRAMSSCVAGLHDHPAAIHHDGSQRGIQIALAPLGLRLLLGIPGAELARTA